MDSFIRWTIVQFKNHSENVNWFTTPTVRESVSIHAAFEVNLIKKFEHITAFADIKLKLSHLQILVGYVCNSSTPWTALLWQEILKRTPFPVIIILQITYILTQLFIYFVNKRETNGLIYRSFYSRLVYWAMYRELWFFSL